jgi:two-component system sensor histidine kinase YesM
MNIPHCGIGHPVPILSGMDRSEGPRSARYRRRLYRGYLWIALIPFSFFVVLGAAAIFLTQNIVIGELSSLKERNLRQVADNIELWFGEADSIALGLSTDPELSRGAEYLLKTGIPSHADLKLSRSLQSLLASAVNSRLYLHSITVATSSSSGLIITSTEGLIKLKDYADSEWLDGTEAHVDQITPWTVVRAFRPLPNFPLRIPILSFYRNILGTGSLERKGVLAVNVDLRKLDALLEKSAAAAGGRFILVDKVGGTIVAGMKPGEDEAGILAALFPNWAREATSSPATAPALRPLKLGNRDYIVASLGSERFPFVYFLLSPAEEFRRIPRQVTLIGGALAFLALAVGIALALALARRNFRLLDCILDIVEAAGQGKPLPPFHESRNEALDYVTLAVLKTFVEHDYYKIRLSERELRQRTLELTALQAQMNPHFLFNTLTTIAFKAMQLTGGKNDVSDMVKQLSDMLAYSLADARVPATIGAEFAQAKRYADLQNRRFGARFHCEWSEDAVLATLPCIKLILQPLVENAFEHGFAGDKRSGIVGIRVSRDPDSGRVRLEVEDNGTGMAPERLADVRALIAAGAESAGHIGLVNTARRLSLAYGEAADCSVDSVPGRGTRICLLFPDSLPETPPPISSGGISPAGTQT